MAFQEYTPFLDWLQQLHGPTAQLTPQQLEQAVADYSTQQGTTQDTCSPSPTSPEYLMPSGYTFDSEDEDYADDAYFDGSSAGPSVGGGSGGGSGGFSRDPDRIDWTARVVLEGCSAAGSLLLVRTKLHVVC